MTSLNVTETILLRKRLRNNKKINPLKDIALDVQLEKYIQLLR